MKLIDLLVQELPKRGGWPDGAESAQQSAIDKEVYFKGDCTFCSGIFLSETAHDEREAEITREQYEAALQQPVWNGEGLPPVGCECDVIPHNNRWGFLGGGAYTGVVIAYDGEDFWFKDNNGVHTVSRTDKVNFHAIRTEAERKREETIAAIYKSNGIRARDGGQQSAIDVYDAIAAGKIPGVTLL